MERIYAFKYMYDYNLKMFSMTHIYIYKKTNAHSQEHTHNPFRTT